MGCWPQLRPAEIQAIRAELGLSQADFGRAIGLGDANAKRTVEAWESGAYGHKPSAPSGTALAAISLLRSSWRALRANSDLPKKDAILKAGLPDVLRERVAMEGAPAEKVVKALAEILEKLVLDERREVMEELPYCKRCWARDPRGICQCWNDE